MRRQSGWGFQNCADAFYCEGINIERKMREARRKTKAEAKLAKRQARRLQKTEAPAAGQVK